MRGDKEVWSFGVFCGLMLGAFLFMLGMHFGVINGCHKIADAEPVRAPHEQQPEPMMATAGVSVERWVL